MPCLKPPGFPASLIVLLVLTVVDSTVVTMPYNDTAWYSGDAAYFKCSGTTDRSSEFVASIHIYKAQSWNQSSSSDDPPGGLQGQLFASSRLAMQGYFSSPFNLSRWSAYEEQNSSSAISITINVTDIQLEDSGTYFCVFHMNTAGSEVVTGSAPVTITVSDRIPDLALSLNYQSDLSNGSVGNSEKEELSCIGLRVITLECTAYGGPLQPDAQLWIAGTEVSSRAKRLVHSFLIGNTVGLQIWKTSVTIAYTANVSTVADCTAVHCAGTIPQYKGPTELVTKDVSLRKTLRDCPTPGGEILKMSSNGNAILQTRLVWTSALFMWTAAYVIRTKS